MAKLVCLTSVKHYRKTHNKASKAPIRIAPIEEGSSAIGPSGSSTVHRLRLEVVQMVRDRDVLGIRISVDRGQKNR